LLAHPVNATRVAVGIRLANNPTSPLVGKRGFLKFLLLALDS
jgi:hypothetical protein